MLNILSDISKLKLAPLSPDTDVMCSMLSGKYPFVTHSYPSGAEHNGWSVPNSWAVTKANLYRNGELIYDGAAHPLGVVGYGLPFCGEVTLEELKKHLFYHPTLPDALVYHCDYFYKPWLRDWGICVTHNFYDALEEGRYEVDIAVDERPDTMKVLEWTLAGTSSDVIVLNAHTCHAAQANDGASGAAVGIEVMKMLSELPSRRYTYKLILAAEHLGTVFYTANLPLEERKKIKYAVFLEMLGSSGPPVLQESFTGTSQIDKAARHVLLRAGYSDFKPYRTVVGNDETIWEGYEIPTPSLSRWPYPEYHSDKDNMNIISEDKMNESCKIIFDIMMIMERNCTVSRKFDGLVCLSNPKYDLYISTEDPSIRKMVSSEQKNWHYFMTCLPRYMDGKTSLLDLADKFGLDFNMIYDYILKYQEKGLASLNCRI